jgi:DNA-binding CsgD family transcriptional regulator
MSERRTGRVLPPTARQLEVLRAYVRTGTHAAAARRLDLSIRTVQAHLSALRTRLAVHNEAQAVYVLWLGYRDHLERCRRATHEDCLPNLGGRGVAGARR